MDDHDRLTRGIAAATLAAVLAGCAGGAAISTVPGSAQSGSAGAPQSVSAAPKRVLAKFVVRVPRKRRRRPRYLSPSTESISIVVDRGPSQSVVNANLIPGSAGCSGGVCTIVVNLTPGRHVFDVAAYDGPLSAGAPSGNVLSQNDGFPFTVKLAAANTVGVVLDGVPSSIVVQAPPGEDVGGSQSLGFQLYGAYKTDDTTIYSRAFEVTALDADGNYIAGPGSPSISMTSGATSVFGNGVVQYGSNRATVTPSTFSGGAYNGSWIPFTITAKAQDAGGGAAVTTMVQMQLMARDAPIVIVTDQNSTPGAGRVWAFDELGNPVPRVQHNLDAAIAPGQPAGAAYCTANDLFLTAAETAGEVIAYEADGTLFATAPAPQPLSVYCDAESDTAYVGDAGNPVTEIDMGVFVPFGTAGSWKELGSSAYPATPWGIVLNNNAVYVADETNGVIESYATNGTDKSESRPKYAPTALALVSGQLFESARNFDKVGLYYDITANEFPGVLKPFGFTQDPASGYVYVVNYDVTSGSTVTRYDAEGDAVPLPSGAFSGPVNPLGIAISY